MRTRYGMKSYLIERKENAVVYSIPAQTRFWFVVSYSIGVASTFPVIVFILFGSIIFGRHYSLLNFGVGILVVSVFILTFIYMLNLVIYWLKGKEVLEIDNHGMVNFHRYGLYRFHKEEFHLDKLRSFSLTSKEVDDVEYYAGREEGKAKIVISFWNKVGNTWGKEVAKINFGASLSEADANEVLSSILKDFENVKNQS